MQKSTQTQLQSKTYWQLHLQLLRTLSLVGIVLNATDRLDLFRLKHVVRRLHVDDTLKMDIDFMIDELVTMRINGLESKHDGKKYV